MIEHLIYVLWEDYWRPKIKSILEWIGYIGAAALLLCVGILTLIFIEQSIEMLLQVRYGG